MDDEYAANVIGNLSEEIEAHMRRMESVVVTGQRMANLLYWFEQNCRGFNLKISVKCNEAKELVAKILRYNTLKGLSISSYLAKEKGSSYPAYDSELFLNPPSSPPKNNAAV
jgi:hypothetical protein